MQEIEEQRRLDNLQIEYERRAQERREALDRNTLRMSHLLVQDYDYEYQRQIQYGHHIPSTPPENSAISERILFDRQIVFGRPQPPPPLLNISDTSEHNISDLSPLPLYAFEG